MKADYYKTAYKLRFVPLIFAAVLLTRALILKYIFLVPVGKFLPHSAIFAFAAFLFMRVMQDSEKERKEREKNPEPVKTETAIRSEAAGDEIKLLTGQNIPIASVRLLFAALLIPAGITLIVSNGEILFGLALCAVGFVVTLLSVIWLLEHITRLKQLRRAMTIRSFPEILFEVPIPDLDDEASPVLRVFDNGTACLLTEWFPWKCGGITEEMITGDMAAFIGAKVFREDKDRFVIENGDYGVLEKTLQWLANNARKFDKSDVMETLRAYLGCGGYADELFQQFESKGLQRGLYHPGLFPYENFLNEEFPAEFLMWIDWREEDKDIIRYCEDILKTETLTAEAHVGEQTKRYVIIINYKGETREIDYEEDEPNRDDTIKALNNILKPCYEIRFCGDSDGGDTLAFLPLSADQWSRLENEFGREAVDARFVRISEESKWFQ